MVLSTFKIGTKEYVIVPRRDYDQLTRKSAETDSLRRRERYHANYLTKPEQDALDSKLARKAMEDIRSGKVVPIPHEEFKRRLGL